MAIEQGIRQAERRLRREQHPDQLRWIAQARSLAAALDLLPQPIVLLLPGETLRVWHANAAARHRLSAHPQLSIRAGVLHAAPAYADLLAASIERACAQGPGHSHELVLRAATGSPTLRLQMLDFGASRDLPVSTVLMLELHEAASSERSLQALCTRYGLTRKEAESALGLCAMGSVDELARCTGRSVHTVRTQLKAAMQKTGTHTQAGLVALVVHRPGG